ncbi:MAG: hypothetical protein LAQ30_04935 [Acidobacteriia bacterium]|nr:hypothetical protein [Terriglobia bacterium]
MALSALSLPAQDPPAAGGEPSVVRIARKPDGGFQLLRNGKPYFIKGGGGRDPATLLAAGGNSVRGGGDAANLDRLHAAGISVQYGLSIGKPRQGFDYSNKEAVAKQLDAALAVVKRFKNHPAILAWALGNESELSAKETDRLLLWAALEDLARAIKAEDPNHPVITVLAGASRLAEVKKLCPSLDAIGLNAYGSMLQLPEAVAAAGWDKPYIVTEFGPRGHWEVAKTPWGLPIEDSSTEKADFYLKAYRHAVEGRPQALGAYVFLWGNKQEKTHTWYGMFLPDGSPTEAADVMTYFWTGKWPANRAPRIGPGKIKIAAESGATDRENEFLPGTKLRCSITPSDPEGDPLKVAWDLRVDVSDNPSSGGDREPASVPIDGAVLSTAGNEARIQVPDKPGNYRIFVYVRDPAGKAATANVPIRAVPPAAR